METTELLEIIGRGDEVPANGMTLDDLDMDYFRRFFEKHYGESLDEQDLPLNTILDNMNLMKDGVMNVAGQPSRAGLACQ